MKIVWKCQPSSLTLLQSPRPQTQMLSLTQLGFQVSQNSLREASFLFSHLGRYGPQQFPNKHTRVGLECIQVAILQGPNS